MIQKRLLLLKHLQEKLILDKETLKQIAGEAEGNKIVN